MISHQLKCIFIHIPKNAGTAIEDVLFPRPRTKEQFWGVPNKYQTGGLQHLMAKHIKLEVPSDIFNSYFKFTVIRNPWDKAVSQFCYTKQKRPDLLKLLNLSKRSSFRQYLHKISEKNHVQWEEQYKFIEDNSGKVLVDYICRFEQLESDFQKIILNLGLDPELFELPHTNQTKRKHYSHYYDDKSRQILAEKYQTDIEKFGYFFES